MAMTIAERIKAAQSRLDEDNQGGFDKNEKIFFELSEGEHHIRLVSQWVEVHSHFIGNTKFTKEKLFPDSAFEGDNHLRKFVTCPDFDPTTEMPAPKSTCVLCYLYNTMNNLINSGSDQLTNEDIEFFKRVRSTSFVRNRHLFLCLDRDNPEIAPGRKGLKIIEFPRKLFQQYLVLLKKNPKLDFASPDKAPELCITVAGTGKDATYSITYEMDGTEVLTTALTDEERKYQRHDILKIVGKPTSQKLLYEKLRKSIRQLIDDYEVPSEPVDAKKDDDDDDDEPPRKPSRRDDDEDEAPRKPSYRRRDDDDDDEPPRSKRPASSEPDDDEEEPF